MSSINIQESHHFKSDLSGPKVIINAGTHGNETAGIEVAKILIHQLKQGIIQISRGELVITFGNPKAMELNQRYSEVDLNRCFGSKPPTGFDESTYEWQRAQALKEMWGEKVDYLFDLHATIKPSDPFSVVPDLEQKLKGSREEIMGVLKLLQTPKILTGPGLYPPSGEPIYGDTYISQQGGVGITIEAGWLEDPSLQAQLHQRMKNILSYLGMIEGECIVPEAKLELLNVYQNIITTPGFKWTKEWGNFDELKAGTIFAEDDSDELKVDRNSVIIFPRNDTIVGQEACLLAEMLESS